MEQGSPEWLAARCGKITSSRLNDVMATVKTGEAASRRDYKMDLMVEILTGNPADSYMNAHMQWGIDQEPYARSCYEFAHGVEVEQTGLVIHPDLSMFGASPDGLIGEDGLVEIKCPKTSTHVNWMLAGVVPPEHVKQIQGQMACTGRAWCDFASYDPRMPVDLQLFVRRIYRDDEMIATIEKAVTALWDEVQTLIQNLGKVKP